MPDNDSQLQLQYISGLEPAPQNLPEVSHRESRAPEVFYHQGFHQPQVYPLQPYPHQPYQPYHHGPALPKPDDPYGSQVAINSPFSPNSQSATLATRTVAREDSRRILGCSRLVFILSCVIGLLSAAVIGLAALAGVETSRASDNGNRAASLSSALASATSRPISTVTVDVGASATSFAAISDGCTDDPEGTTGTRYTSFSLLGEREFTRFCNQDTPHAPILSLFTSNFQTCMDACSGYTKYMPDNGILDPNNENSTCAAVSFIPLWTVKGKAEAGGAPGNCYLKPGPIASSDLKPANIGTECHSAILADP